MASVRPSVTSDFCSMGSSGREVVGPGRLGVSGPGERVLGADAKQVADHDRREFARRVNQRGVACAGRELVSAKERADSMWVSGPVWRLSGQQVLVGRVG